ncbi:hypothetical protein KQ313_04755 [Synechococcus sp. CS-1325]|uniref:hypothetical protein n=1 Tax=unclassified Synechococcus TaxID=2626047 RepID=UPI000DB7AC5B|nr:MULTISPECIES: hypothetical protein [unclassified Synechococcus]PZU98269.1 MAG: hypothetical protein DCF24_10995 [Cyanobium sp.]MCT0198985.1 hypothetical protein [Synechococcus sp. CS-1325]MCT0212465.1 hypothetical protein [Synechococcus sp. CS-1326]MCT0231039.1 hypothetical protein [Synechococcus sp. CS-1324]MCT0231982.1 hypothetical protein [Synechococcus sp. CS-1327]
MTPPLASQRTGTDPLSAPEQGLWLALLGAALGLFSLALLLLPQQLAQAPAHRGLVVLHLAADGSLRLWNRPLSPQQLPGLLQQAGRLNSQVRVRLIPSPATPWAMVQRFIPLLEVSALPFEIQLPVPDPAS